MKKLKPGGPHWRETLQHLVVTVASRLVGPLSFDEAVDATLAELGAFARAGRAYLFLFSRDGGTMRNTHEWCAEGVAPQIEQLQAVPVDMVPWWTAQVRARRAIHLRDLDDLPPEAGGEREILAAQGIRSLLVVPVSSGCEVVGFIGFDDVVGIRAWSEDDLGMLRLGGELVGSALARQRAEAERARLEERLLATQRLKAVGRLAGGIAHDFNNLLAVITTYVEVVRDELPPGSEAAEDLGEVLVAAARARDLVRSLQDFDHGGRATRMPVDLERLVRDHERLLRSVLGERVELRLRLRSGLPRVRVDEARFEQVLVNLALNARDAMPEGGRLELETCLVDDGEPRVRLRITDTGCGMPPEVLEQAFDPFFTTKQIMEGQGMGLASVYGIVTGAGGEVRLQSDPGEGTTVSIDLPLAEAADSTPIPREGAERRILLVEDEAALRKITRRMLQGAGYQVQEVAHARDALALAQAEGPPDLLVTDVMMPDVTGPELARELEAMRPGLPVLFISGYTGDALEETGVGPRARLLTKPFSRRQLLEAVESALDG